MDDTSTPEIRTDTISKLNEWRLAHSKPLGIALRGLRTQASGIQPGVIIAERLKRLASIEEKLTREGGMRLSRMQDIVGCRAVFRDLDLAEALVATYSGTPNLRVKNYVEQPRKSGYRSIHLIWTYAADDNDPCDKMQVEIQVRSRLQHTWATAVEIVSTYTGQDLKSDHPKGDGRWVRFFALMGSAMARMEGCPLVPETPQSKRKLRKELQRLYRELRVQELMRQWKRITDIRSTFETSDSNIFLVTISPANQRWLVQVKSFRETENDRAKDELLAAEKNVRDRNTQVALVAVESIDTFRLAYPNYGAETTEFMRTLQGTLYGTYLPGPVGRAGCIMS